MNSNIADFFENEDNEQDMSSYNKYINETIIRQNIQNYIGYENIYKVCLDICIYVYMCMFIYMYINI
jgi:hypothetical protein